MAVKATKNKANKVKSVALEVNLSSVEATQKAIADLGMFLREHNRLETQMNDEIGAVTEKYAQSLGGLKQQAAVLQAGIQAYCESNRDKLTQNGKTKTVNFTTGEVNWRLNPPSVNIRGKEGVLDMLEKLGLDELIRIKKEPNKEAILEARDKVKGIAGISIKDGVELFNIAPFESKDTQLSD